MAKRNRSSKHSAKKVNAPKSTQPFRGDLSAWALDLINRQPDDFPAEERVLLVNQAKAFADIARTAPPLLPDPTAPEIIRNRKALKQLGTSVAGADVVVIDLETSALDPRNGEIVGIGLALATSTYYLPISHRLEDSKLLLPDQLHLDAVVQALSLGSLSVAAHNAKFEFRWLRHHTGVVCNFVWDTMVAARLLRSDQSAELKDLAVRELDVPDWGMTKAEIERVQFMPIDRVARYCAKDCWYTLELMRKQQTCLL
jgi:DNA polymerase-1